MGKITKVAAPKVGLAKNKEAINNLNVGDANMSSKDYPATKTSGVKTRGNGAAVRGITARGPMA